MIEKNESAIRDIVYTVLISIIECLFKAIKILMSSLFLV